MGVTARDVEKVHDLAEAHPDTAPASTLDVADDAQVIAAEERFGAVDLLVNSGGHGYRAAVEEGEDGPAGTPDGMAARCRGGVGRWQEGPAERCTDRSCFVRVPPSTVEVVDHRKDVQDFLVSRRARLSPEQAGLPTYGGQRRVPGLRREEVALLAGLSVDYYGRLERGHLNGASESVLEAVARALQLSEVERQHLFDLARSGSTTHPVRRRKPTGGPRPAVTSILAGMTGIPAYVRTSRMEILAANPLCQALYGGVLDDERLPVNLARYLFLDPHSRGFFLDWDHVADDFTGALRTQVGRDSRDRTLSDLIGELSTRSDEFVARWAKQNVRLHQSARKRLRNRIVGDIELTGNALEMPGDDLTLIAYTADPGSPAEDQLRLLASWAATQPSLGTSTATPTPDSDPSPTSGGS